MEKRIFVGLSLSACLTSYLTSWRSTQKDVPVRWIREEDLHITLVSPWYAEDTQAVVKRLALVSVRKFSFYFSSITTGPTERNPTVIWMRGKAVEDIVTLKDTVISVLQKEKEQRPFLPHVTLARFEKKQVVISENISFTEQVKSFILYQSHLSPTGAHYEQLAEFPLR